MGTLSTKFYTTRIIEAYFKKEIDDIDIIDIGCSNRPLTETCDTFDLPNPYYPDIETQNIKYKGDARFASNVVNKKYDVIYSSHLLEDFYIEEIKNILSDWTKFLKENGIIILILPDQKLYIQDCKSLNKEGNSHHKYENFGLDFFKEYILNNSNFKIIHEMEFYNNQNWQFKYPRQQYNFLIGLIDDNR